MNITLNTLNTSNRYNRNYFVNDNNRKMSAPSFTSVSSAIPTKSRFLDPFKKVVDGIIEFLAKHYSAKMYQSKLAELIAKNSDKLDGIVGHMQVIGSAIISGMYMLETWKNQDLSQDRKPTLIVNQFLTLVAATIGAYTVDKMLNKQWNKLTEKYAKVETGNPNIVDDLEKINKQAKALFEKEIKDGLRSKNTKFIPKKLEEYVGEIMPETGIAQRIKGMSILKKLLVFGVIYRFLSPVLVTPFANMIGNKFFDPEAKAKKQAQKVEIASASNDKNDVKKAA